MKVLFTEFFNFHSSLMFFKIFSLFWKKRPELANFQQKIKYNIELVLFHQALVFKLSSLVLLMAQLKIYGSCSIVEQFWSPSDSTCVYEEITSPTHWSHGVQSVLNILISCNPDPGPDPTLLPQSDIKAAVEEEKDEPTPSSKILGFFHQALTFGHGYIFCKVQKHTEMITSW